MAHPQGKVVYRSPNVVVRFKLDRDGIRKIALGPELRSACHDVVESKALPYAIGISPVSDRRRAQHYIFSFQVHDVLTGMLAPENIGHPPMLRVGARLINTAPHAAAVEWGTAKNGGRGHRVLGRTLDYLNSAAGPRN